MVEVVALIVTGLAFLAVLSVFFLLLEIRRSVKEIRQSFDRIETGLELLTEGLTILLYLEVKNRPDLLEKSPELKQKALEAAERLKRKWLTASVAGKMKEGKRNE